jgi:peroxiredoxin
MKKWIIVSALALFFSGVDAVQAAGPQINQTAPDFTLLDSQGKSTTLGSFQGKYVVLEWYNHDCPFVRKQYDSGAMQKLQAAYTAKGVVWLSILSSAEGKEGYMTPAQAESSRATEKSSATALLLDPDGKVGKLYQAKTTPNMYVINPLGKLIYMGAIDDRPTTDVADVPGAKNYVSRALDQAMSGKTITDPVTKPYGCSVKYH